MGTKSGTISFFELHRANNPADTRHPAAACWISCWKTSWQEVGKKNLNSKKFLNSKTSSWQRAATATDSAPRPPQVPADGRDSKDAASHRPHSTMDNPSFPTMTEEVVASQLHALLEERKRRIAAASAALAPRVAASPSAAAAHKRARATAGAGDGHKPTGTLPNLVPVSPSLDATFDDMLNEGPELPQLSPGPAAATLGQLSGHDSHIGGIHGGTNTISISNGTTINSWASAQPNFADLDARLAVHYGGDTRGASKLMDELLHEKGSIELQAQITLLQRMLPSIQAANRTPREQARPSRAAGRTHPPVFPVRRPATAPAPMAPPSPAAPPPPTSTVQQLDGGEQGHEEPDYEVEKIIGTAEGESGIKLYKVRWMGYGSDEDTWEPAATLDSAKECIAAFENPGHNVIPGLEVQRISGPVNWASVLKPTAPAPQSTPAPARKSNLDLTITEDWMTEVGFTADQKIEAKQSCDHGFSKICKGGHSGSHDHSDKCKKARQRAYDRRRKTITNRSGSRFNKTQKEDAFRSALGIELKKKTRNRRPRVCPRGSRGCKGNHHGFNHSKTCDDRITTIGT